MRGILGGVLIFKIGRVVGVKIALSTPSTPKTSPASPASPSSSSPVSPTAPLTPKISHLTRDIIVGVAGGTAAIAAAVGSRIR